MILLVLFRMMLVTDKTGYLNFTYFQVFYTSHNLCSTVWLSFIDLSVQIWNINLTHVKNLQIWKSANMTKWVLGYNSVLFCIMFSPEINFSICRAPMFWRVFKIACWHTEPVLADLCILILLLQKFCQSYHKSKPKCYQKPNADWMIKPCILDL